MRSSLTSRTEPSMDEILTPLSKTQKPVVTSCHTVTLGEEHLMNQSVEANVHACNRFLVIKCKDN